MKEAYKTFEDIQDIVRTSSSKLGLSAPVHFPSTLAMKFSAPLLAQIVLATSAFAVPSGKERLARRVQRREEARLSSQPRLPGSGLVEAPETTNSTHPTEFSSNWSGAGKAMS